MSEYSDLKREFPLFIAKLIIWIYEQGYELTFGESYDDDGKGHMKGSLHYDGLAQDLNLFKNKVWLKRTEDHKEIGAYWESLDPRCRWGGRFSDGNHYSMTFGGRM